MKVLLTGASSFTGYWFARTLAAEGHTVVGTFRAADSSSYEGVRGDRVIGLTDRIECAFGQNFGTTAFLNLIAASKSDILALHGAEMTNYRSWDFDPVEATRLNTLNLRSILETFIEAGGTRVIATGSVFEPFEGIGDADQKSFNPYGLSKHLSYEIVRMECEKLGLALGKFVIPNPFGPFEEPRFVAYLIREWTAGNTPTVGTPVYIRDNIPVSLLAKCYADFVGRGAPALGSRNERCCPSGYVEAQGAFARRIAQEINKRLGTSYEVEFANQTDFPEPLIKVNDELAMALHPEWDESGFWDAHVDFYASHC